MAQAIDIPFVRGRGDNLDPRIAPAGTLERASNVVPVVTGRFAKRRGYDALPRTTPLHGTLTGGVHRVYGHRGAICALQQSTPDVGPGPSITLRHHTWSDAHQGWIAARSNSSVNSAYGDGPMPVAGRVETQQLRRAQVSTANNTARDSQPYAASCAAGGIEVYAYQTGDGKCRIDIHDALSHTLLSSRTVGENVWLVRAWRWGTSSGFIGVGWLNTSSLCVEYVRVLVTDPAPLADISAVVTTSLEASVASATWDVVGFGSGNALFAIGSPTGASLLAITAGGTEVAPDVDVAPDWAIAVGGTDETLAVIYAATPSTREVRCALYSVAGADLTQVSDAKVADCAPADCYHLAVGIGRPAGTDGPSDYAIGLWSEAGAIPGASASTRIFDCTRLAAPGDRGYIYGVTPCSAVFADGQTPLVWLLQNTTSSAQRARYLYALEVPYAVAARVAWGTAYDPAVYVHPRPTRSASGLWVAAWNDVTSGPITSPSALGYSLTAYRIDLESRARALVASDGAASVIACASSAHYDGQRVCEVGWYEWPPTPTHTTGAGSVTAGTYSYVVVYEEVDANGDLHQSPPSLPLTVTLTESQNVTVATRAPYHSRRDAGNHGGIRVALYRTTNRGTIYYRVGEVTAWGVGAAVSIVDSTTDGNLTGRAPLRYSAGVVEPFAPPPAEGVCAHGGRVWLACGDRAYYSHQREAGWGLEYCAAHYVVAPGPITGLASTGDAVLLLTEDDAWMVWGDGPDRLGTGAFSLPQYAGGSGCPRDLGGARSVASTRQGVVWRGRDGLYLLPRGAVAPQLMSGGITAELAAYPIVAYVVDDEAAQCVRVGLVASESGIAAGREAQWWYGLEEPIWTTSALPVLGVHTGAVVADRAVVAVAQQPPAGASTAGVYRQGTGYADGYGVASTSPIVMRLSTRPLYPGGRNAEVRVRELLIDGERVATSTSLLVTAYHDGAATTPTTYALAGSGELALQHNCQVQRCTSVSVDMVEDSSTAGVELAGLSLSAEPLRVERRRGADWRR